MEGIERILASKTAIEIYGELEEARASYDRGEYEAFDEALDEISKKYNLEATV